MLPLLSIFFFFFLLLCYYDACDGGVARERTVSLFKLSACNLSRFYIVEDVSCVTMWRRIMLKSAVMDVVFIHIYQSCVAPCVIHDLILKWPEK